MKVDRLSLRTIKNYAIDKKVTPSYIYKLIKTNKMEAIIIDGVQFIDTQVYPQLPTSR